MNTGLQKVAEISLALAQDSNFVETVSTLRAWHEFSTKTPRRTKVEVPGQANLQSGRSKQI